MFGLRDRYEAFHKARITDEAVRSAVTLSARYISDRYLPDKAIDVMDEAASKVRMKVYSPSDEVKNLEQKLADIRKEKKRLSPVKILNAVPRCVMKEKSCHGSWKRCRKNGSSMTMPVWS